MNPNNFPRKRGLMSKARRKKYLVSGRMFD